MKAAYGRWATLLHARAVTKRIRGRRRAGAHARDHGSSTRAGHCNGRRVHFLAAAFFLPFLGASSTGAAFFFAISRGVVKELWG